MKIDIRVTLVEGELYYNASDIIYWLQENMEGLGNVGYVNGEYFNTVINDFLEHAKENYGFGR